MTIAISQSQLDQIISKVDNDDVAGAWQLLANFGDRYAAQAYEVVVNPTSFYGIAVRNHWTNTGADFGKFQSVALQHVQQYVDMIGKAKGQFEGKLEGDNLIPDPLGKRDALSADGLLLLPKTVSIESSYGEAVTTAGLKPETAIDLAINQAYTGIEWYGNSPVGLGLESERVSSFRNLPDGLSREDATALVAKTMIDMVHSLDRRIGLPTRQSLSDLMIGMTSLGSLFRGGNDIRIETHGGFNYYYNNKTGTAAMLDKDGKGKAFYKGSEIDIGPDNFRRNETGGYDIKLQDGSWTGAGLDLNIANPVFAINERSNHDIGFSASSGDQTVASDGNGALDAWVVIKGIYNIASSANPNDIGGVNPGEATVQALRGLGLNDLANALKTANDASIQLVTDPASRASLSEPYSNFDAYLSKMNALGKHVLAALNNIDTSKLSVEQHQELASYKTALGEMGKLLVWGRLLNKFDGTVQAFGEGLGIISSALHLIAFATNPSALDAPWARSIPERSGLGLSLLMGGLMGSAAAVSPGPMSLDNGVAGTLYFALLGKNTWDAYARAAGLTPENASNFWGTVVNRSGIAADISDPSQISEAWKQAYPELATASVFRTSDGMLVTMSGAGLIKIDSDGTGIRMIPAQFTDGRIGWSTEVRDSQAKLTKEQSFAPDGRITSTGLTIYDGSGRKVSYVATYDTTESITMYGEDGTSIERVFRDGQLIKTSHLDPVGYYALIVEREGPDSERVLTVTPDGGQIVEIKYADGSRFIENYLNGEKLSTTHWGIDSSQRLHVRTDLPNGKYYEAIHVSADPNSPFAEEHWIGTNNEKHDRIWRDDRFTENFVHPTQGNVTVMKISGALVLINMRNNVIPLPPEAEYPNFDFNKIGTSGALPMPGTPGRPDMGFPGIPTPGSPGFDYGSGSWSSISTDPGNPVMWQHWPAGSDNWDIKIYLPWGVSPPGTNFTPRAMSLNSDQQTTMRAAALFPAANSSTSEGVVPNQQVNLLVQAMAAFSVAPAASSTLVLSEHESQFRAFAASAPYSQA